MRDVSKQAAGGSTPRPRPKPKNLHLDSGSAGYFGVCAKFRDVRIAVHGSRKAYLVQHRGDDGRWQTYRSVEAGAMLGIVLLYDDELAAVAKLLPDEPSEAVKLLRHGSLPVTAAQMAAAARRVRAALRKVPRP